MTRASAFGRRPSLRPRQVSAADAVHRGLLDEDGGYLRVVTARQPTTDLAAWLDGHRDEVHDDLVAHGGVLFRGFAVHGPDDFSEAVRRVSPEMLDYLERAAPRHEVAHRVFTSTEAPADRWIPMHHEMSYSHNWPGRLYFHCATAPADGGRTPLADERRVTARIPAELRERVARDGVRYVRNYGPELDMTWQEGFQTGDRAEVEAYCLRTGADWTWIDGEHLRTSQVRQGTVRHPGTGQELWFNHSHLWHVSTLPDHVADALIADVGEEGLPRNAFHGDGSPFERESMKAVRAAYAEQTRSFAWAEGDVLVLDNHVSVHGRQPFTGDRSVLVAMTDLHVHAA